MVKIVLLCCGFFLFRTAHLHTYFLSILNSRDMFGCLDSQTNVKCSFWFIFFFAFFFFYFYVFNLNKSEDNFINDTIISR